MKLEGGGGRGAVITPMKAFCENAVRAEIKRLHRGDERVSLSSFLLHLCDLTLRAASQKYNRKCADFLNNYKRL